MWLKQSHKRTIPQENHNFIGSIKHYKPFPNLWSIIVLTCFNHIKSIISCYDMLDKNLIF